MLLTVYDVFRIFHIATIGVVEQSQHKLHSQYFCYTFVKCLHSNLSACHRFAQWVKVFFGLSEVGADIESGIDGEGTGFFIVVDHMMLVVQELQCFAV